MIGRLRAAHAHRFELPLLSRPVAFEPSEVPIDPYALGLLLGDGCLTTSTTPSFSTGDPELALSLEMALDGIELVCRAPPTTSAPQPRRRSRRGIVANPVTASLRQLGIPVRVRARSSCPRAISQLVGGPARGPSGTPRHRWWTVTQARRSYWIQYVTTSPRLRDDVAFLVRSLGGIAYIRTRIAAGRPPGRALVARAAPLGCVRARHPAAPDVVPFRLFARRAPTRPSEEAAGRCASRLDRAGGESETVAPGGCSRLALRDRRLHRDPHAERRVPHPRRGPEHDARADEDVPHAHRVRVEGRHQRRRHAGRSRHRTKSGLAVVEEILGDIDDIAFCHLGGRDVVRHKIVQDIVEAYDRFGQQRLEVEP